MFDCMVTSPTFVTLALNNFKIPLQLHPPPSQKKNRKEKNRKETNITDKKKGEKKVNKKNQK